MIGAGAKPSTHLSAILAQYETLRSAMLGEALPPEARSGLIVLLHRGMWGWARTLALATARQEPVPLSARCSNPEPLERRAVIHVLAAMAMNQ